MFLIVLPIGVQWSSSLPNADWFTFLVADFFKWRPSEPFDLIFDYTYVSKCQFIFLVIVLAAV